MAFSQAILVYLTISSAVVNVWGWTPLSSSRTVEIGGSGYYIPAEPLQVLPSTFSSAAPGSLVALTVISTNASVITSAYLDQVIQGYNQDDVYNEGFLQSLLLGSPGNTILDESLSDWIGSKGVEFVLTSGATTSQVGSFITTPVPALNLPPGPYVIGPDAKGQAAIFEALKLEWDGTQSFMKGVYRQPSTNVFTTLSAVLDTDVGPYIAIPSRLYSSEEDKSVKPLAGLRVAVKDIYHFAGLKTSAGNRAYYQIYPKRNVTAPSVQRLIDLGATMLGKTKTVQFANGDRNVDDWVDYHVSFNSRGDGYDQASGSSTGSATAMAAYDWVDAALGSDTGGSIRGPSGANGLFGMRPSVGAITTDEVVSLSDVLDTLGVITRDPYIFASVVKNWYGTQFADYSAFPKKIYASSGFANVQNTSVPIYQNFLAKLGDFLGAQQSNLSLYSLWNQTSGTGVGLDVYGNTTYPALIAYHQWNFVGKQLFADYGALFNNRTPHINPGVLVRWKYGQSLSPAAFDEQLDHQKTIEAWASANLFKEDNQSCSDSIYAYPQNDGTYTSQEKYYGSTVPVPFGFSDGRLAVHARVPDLVIPIGQVPYMSSITNIVEYLPVSISLVTRRNCDFVLANLVKALADAGIISAVQTGRFAFPMN